MPRPEPFNNVPDAVISFDWVDISSGKGYRTFYGGYGSAYFLTTNTNINSNYQAISKYTH